MISFEKKRVEFSFFGDRNYVDVTTISKELFKKISVPMFQLKKIEFSILKTVSYNGLFTLSKIKPIADYTVAVSFQYLDENYFGFVEDRDDLINQRFDEIPYVIENYFLLEGQSMTITKPLNDDFVYNYMKMGKELLVKNSIGLNPRVAKYQFDFVPENADYGHLSMKIKLEGKSKFYRLDCYFKDSHFGYVIVKVLS